MQYSVHLPESFEVTSRELSVKLDLSKIGAEVAAKAMLHGLKQKIADAAAGAVAASLPEKKEGESKEVYEAACKAWAKDGVNAGAIAAKGQALMQKVVDTLEKGDWGVERGESAAISDAERKAGQLWIDHAELTFPKGTKTDDRIKLALAALGKESGETQKAVADLAADMVRQEMELRAAQKAKLGALSALKK